MRLLFRLPKRYIRTSSGLNVISNPNQYSDGANGVLVGLPTNGFPSDFTIPAQSGLEWALYPSASNGSITTYVPDVWTFIDGIPLLYHGGSWTIGDAWNNFTAGQNSGPFFISLGHSGSFAMDFIGCRLWERPPKVA